MHLIVCQCPSGACVLPSELRGRILCGEYSAWEQSYSEFMKAHRWLLKARRSGNLSPSGHADLARMQAYADYCRDREFPRPTGVLEQLEVRAFWETRG